MPYTVISSDTHTVWVVSPVADANSANPGSPISLTGAVSAAVEFVQGSKPPVAGTGSASIGTGTVIYRPSPLDISVPGPMQAWFSITFSDGSVLPLQPIPITVFPAP